MSRGSDNERQSTDESLQRERQKADAAVVEHHNGAQEHAETVVALARERAAAVLAAARERADALESPSHEVTSERQAADEALQREYAEADQTAREQRSAQEELLERLFAIERQLTNDHLRIERAQSDVASEHRNQLLAQVVHDLHNFVQVISLHGRALNKVADPSARSHGNKLKSTCDAMSRLVADLLDLAAIETGRLTVTPHPNDARKVVEDVGAALGPVAEAHGLEVSIAIAGGPHVVRFDSARIVQVLTNFMVNAIKFTPRGGSISVHLKREGSHEIVSVSDTGIGMPPEAVAAIEAGRPFRGRDHSPGLGLGLFIARSLVEAHGGKLSCESKVGVGTTFSFSLPCA